jgi:5-methyltetrahydrofolate--homocysteine methyltransferase
MKGGRPLELVAGLLEMCFRQTYVSDIRFRLDIAAGKKYHPVKSSLKKPTKQPAGEENSMSDLKAIGESIYAGNSRESVKFTKMELEKGVPWEKILKEAMLPALTRVGKEFSEGFVYLPELIAAGNAMTKCVEAIKAGIPSMGLGGKGVFVIGTVFGDVHDIGKNIVKICLEGAGFRVVDLGTDVSPESFSRACRENKADLAGISALLSSTMLNMEQAVSAIRGENPGVKVMVGGAPLTEEIARKMGADGFAPDAYLAAKKAEDLLAGRR